MNNFMTIRTQVDVNYCLVILFGSCKEISKINKRFPRFHASSYFDLKFGKFAYSLQTKSLNLKRGIKVLCLNRDEELGTSDFNSWN